MDSKKTMLTVTSVVGVIAVNWLVIVSCRLTWLEMNSFLFTVQSALILFLTLAILWAEYQICRVRTEEDEDALKPLHIWSTLGTCITLVGLVHGAAWVCGSIGEYFFQTSPATSSAYAAPITLYSIVGSILIVFSMFAIVGWLIYTGAARRKARGDDADDGFVY